MAMIETRLLKYFLTVAREKNLTRAASLLYITQPTLSRQMTLLEEELGVQFFERSSRPLKLTDEGILLMRRAEEILELVEKTQNELSVGEEMVEGGVSIGCGELSSVKLLCEWIAHFRQQYPHVSFEVYTANADSIKKRMENGLTDIGLLLEPIDIERYEYMRMPVKERWAALMPLGVPLAKRQAVTAKELSDIPVILPSRQKVQSEVANWFGESFESLNIAAVSNLSTNAALLVQAGLGYALTIEGSMPFMDQTDISMVPLSPPLYSTSVIAWKRNQPFSAAVKRFIKYVKCLKSMEQ